MMLGVLRIKISNETRQTLHFSLVVGVIELAHVAPPSKAVAPDALLLRRPRMEWKSSPHRGASYTFLVAQTDFSCMLTKRCILDRLIPPHYENRVRQV